MDQNIRDAAIADNIDGLYESLTARVLEIIDESPFVQTPLHLAASSGSTHFAIEVLSLKPSFGKKLDLDGNGPVQVAIKCNKKETVRRLVDYDPELLRVQGKMRSTPLLDYVARVDGQDYDGDVLALFLLRCPECIEDLNIWKETAVHIALRSGNVDAFKVLLGWLQQSGNLHVLDWEDENGDTALHVAVAVAATENDLEVVRLLIQNVQLNKKNLTGKTALNIALQNALNPNGFKIINMLRSAGAKINTDLPPRKALSEGLVYKESHVTRLLQGRERNREGKSSLENLSAETRSMLLVMAVLSPPGGVTSGSDGFSHNGLSKVPYGKVQMGFMSFSLLLFLNSVPFLASIVMIIMLLPKNQYKLVFVLPLLSLLFSYSISAAAICPHATETSRTVFVIAVFSAAVIIYIGSLFLHLLKTYF